MSNRRNNYVRHKGRGKRKTRSSRTPPTSTASAAPSRAAQAAKTAAPSPRGPSLRPWWERIPGRLEYEQACLDAWGVRWELDPEEFENKKVVIRLWTVIDGEEVLLVGRYPDTYPYTRIEVMTDDLSLAHHQNPFEKNLCLLGQATDNWNPDKDTLAGILQSQLDLVLSTGTSDDPADVVDGLEEAQGEPISSYYTYAGNTALFIDGAWSINRDIRNGRITVGYQQRSEFSWLGAALEVQDDSGTPLAALDSRLGRLFPKHIFGRWVRSPHTLVENDPERFRQLLVEIDPSLGTPRFQAINTNEALDVIGIIQPEELSHRKSSDGWIFSVNHRIKDQNAITHTIPYLVRADRAGLSDLSSRIPELRPLQSRKIALVGLGCIGAPSALHMARGGVSEIRIIDGDNVEAGTTVRWPLGMSAAGTSKADAIAEFINQNYPYTKAVPFNHRIGTALPQPLRDNEVLAEVLDGADLLYEASADLGIQLLLSDLARENGMPYICISATHGGWGGIVARVWPDNRRGCWRCLQYSFIDGSIPLPPQDPSQFFQPAGCGSPTFRAASFDVEEISLHGVRMAIATLASGVKGGYPDSDWDVAIIGLREDNGNLASPSVQTYPLKRNDACKNHQM